MIIGDEYEIIVKCKWELRFIGFVHEFSNFKTVNIF